MYLDTTVGVLVSLGIERGWFQYAIISDQGDVREVIGPFSNREEANNWLAVHPAGTNETQEIVFMVMVGDKQ